MKKTIADIVNELNQESYNLLITKNKDYSNDNLIHTGAKGISARLVDKAQRLFNLADAKDINHESIQDSILDLINYTHLLNIEKQKALTQSTKFAFLSGPIDDVDLETANGWRLTLARHLLKLGVTSFNPSGAFILDNSNSAEAIVQINKEAIKRSDLIIANLADQGRGFGTIREIEYAKALGKQVIIIGELQSLASYDCVVVPDFLALYEYLDIAIPKSKEKAKENKEDGKENGSSKKEKRT